LTTETERRIASEQKGYNLTGRVVGLKVEADGDITLALKDASGNRVGTGVPKFPSAPSGVRFGRLFSAGRCRAFLSISKHLKSSKFASNM
jgi:hypothetical protein